MPVQTGCTIAYVSEVVLDAVTRLLMGLHGLLESIESIASSVERAASNCSCDKSRYIVTMMKVVREGVEAWRRGVAEALDAMKVRVDECSGECGAVDAWAVASRAGELAHVLGLLARRLNDAVEAADRLRWAAERCDSTAG